MQPLISYSSTCDLNPQAPISFMPPATWLAADINGDKKIEIVQLSGTGNPLRIDVYAADHTGSFSPLPPVYFDEGPRGVAFLTGDVNHDGRDEVIQCWSNDGSLGMIVYGADANGVFSRLWRTDDIGEGSGADAWLIGDINNDGMAEIIQVWSNNGSLAMNVYGWDGTGMKVQMHSEDMGEGSRAIAWLIGDFNNDGKAEIMQCWKNNDRLAMFMWGTQPSGTQPFDVQLLDSNNNLGPLGVSGMLNADTWLVADVNGDGAAEIVQAQGNGSILGMNVYGWSYQRHLHSLMTSSDMGEGSHALKWLVGDVDADGRTEIIQLYANGNKLGVIVYGDTYGSGGLSVIWKTDDVGEGPLAMFWLAGRFTGSTRTELAQGWTSKFNLGLLLYRETQAMGTPKQLDNQTKMDLLTAYAPRVLLAPNEEYFPSSIEWASPNLTRYNGPDGQFWLKTKETLRSPSDDLPFFRGDLASAPVYAFWVEKPPFVDLIYFFYYPYNRGKTILNTMYGNHVSDWEHLTVRLMWQSTTGVEGWLLNPHGVLLSAHDFDGAYYWSQLPKVPDTTHPIAYAAWGSHGLWLLAGEHTYEDLGPLGTLVDTCGAGTTWDTWTKVAGYDYLQGVPLGGAPWPRYLMDNNFTQTAEGQDPSSPASGAIYRWGNEHVGQALPRTDIYRLEDGPEGPVSKSVWDTNRFA